ncbi:MAG TPA: tetraacyldisaccharide 4'-kinase [Pyrinomonadaceae bacterium]|nr:tetraacyldisaccharide 4'-kinase [Pyrinomonadaceae bacterium]
MSVFSNLVLPPLSAVYGALTALRTAAYEKGLLKTTRLPVPVISIGNITVGGTGKTPLVAWVSRALTSEGRKVCILTRGYGRINAGKRIVVSDGSSVLADAAQTGDEPLWLAESLKGVVVICDSDRAAAGQWAISNLAVDVFVLDDGFQHLQLARDLNILAIDASNPWGGGRLLPHGRLRESRRGVSRADCAIITRAEQQEDASVLKSQIKELVGEGPIFISRMRAKGIRQLPADQLNGIGALPSPVAAFCGIGNPSSFFNLLLTNGVQVIHAQTFADHHHYNQADINALSEQAKRLGAQSLITTAKDAVKLRKLDFGLPCYVLEIEIAIDHEDKLRDLIRHTIGAS